MDPRKWPKVSRSRSGHSRTLARSPRQLADPVLRSGKSVPLSERIAHALAFFSIKGPHCREGEDQSVTAANLDTALRHDLRIDRSDRILSLARPSILSRIVHASIRLFFAFLVGVGATLAWQSYGDDAVDLIRAQSPSLAEWLPASTGKPTNGAAGTAQQQLKPALAAADQQLPAIDAARGTELEQQLKPVVMDLATVKESLQSLAAEQEKVTQSIDRLERGQQAIRQKLSSVAPPKPVVHHAPTPRPVQAPAQPAAQSAPSRPISVPSAQPPRQ
jgi:hypothetical protein